MEAKAGTLDMDKQTQVYVILAGACGLVLALMTTPPKRIKDAMIAFIAGLSGCLFVGPAIAEIITNIGQFVGWSWMDASPETRIFAALTWLSGMLGFQLVIVINNNFLHWLESFTSQGIAGFIRAVFDWIKSFPIKSQDGSE